MDFSKHEKPATSLAHALRTPLYTGVYRLTCSSQNVLKNKDERSEIHAYICVCSKLGHKPDTCFDRV